MKRVVFIPPNGMIFNNDFSIKRLSEYFENDLTIYTILLKLDDKKNIDNFMNVDEVIDVSSADELFKKLMSIEYDVIFHRSWMLAYPFAKKILENFDNVIVNIKDWEVCTKKEYEVAYGIDAVEDFSAIEYIFKNSKLIFSHYTKEQAIIWANQYNVEVDKFIFFPEYCYKNNFQSKTVDDFKVKKLVLASSLAPSSYPEDLSPSKANFRSMKLLTSLGIEINYVLPPSAYSGVEVHSELFQDVLFEDKFNDNFNLLEGKVLSSALLDKFHFGYFELEDSTKSQYKIKYAIPSKFAFYLEAGIPMLVNSRLESLSKYVKKYNLGIVFNNDDLSSFVNILDISLESYVQMIEDIKIFRETKFEFSKIDINKLFFN